MDYTHVRDQNPCSGCFAADTLAIVKIAAVVDPVTTDANTGSSFNRYAYANNSPYKYIDPDGRFAIPLLVGGSLAVGAIAANSPQAKAASRQAMTSLATGMANSMRMVVAAVTLPSTIMSSVGRPSTWEPGPHAGESIPARGPGRGFTSDERNKINQIGADTGCHTCGATEAGTKSGNFVLDHQPSSALNPTNAPQSLYPHCIDCSRQQGGDVNKEKNWKNPSEPAPVEPKTETK